MRTLTIALQEAAGAAAGYFSNQESSFNSRVTAGGFFNRNKFKRYFKNSSYISLGFVLFLVIIISFVLFKHFFTKSPMVAAASAVQQTKLPAPLAQETLNKSFTFPLKDASGKEVSQLQYVLQNAEIDNQIILKGQKAVAVQGREFLIFNLKINNNYTKSVSLNTRDYIRLAVNSSSEELAPDIYNDPVEVQAISTKYTRLGFAINTSDHNLILQVGEITGPKQEVKLNLK